MLVRLWASPTERLGPLTVAATTNGRYSDNPDRDWMLRALRGDITSDAAYQIVRNTRWMWRSQLLNDPEAVAALNIGDNAHIDDPARFEPLDETWQQPFDPDPATTAAFEQRAGQDDFADGYQPEWDLDTPPDPQETFIDWSTFWDDEGTDEEWLVDQVFARGRGHALYAQAKQGKSLFVLHAAARLAATNPAADVVYLDYEMTRSDIRDRLEDMGYGPADDLSRLHYALLPSIPPLDTIDGANALLELVRAVQRPSCDLLAVIDTTGRAVVGEENSNDTIRGFYRWTGSALKRHEVTWVRLDHAGKDATKGQRGGSAKNDDVDIVWKLKAGDQGAIILHREAARMAWVPEKVSFTRSDGPLRYVAGPEAWPAGTKHLADELAALGLPADITRNKARAALKEAGVSAANDVLGAALRFRRTGLRTALTELQRTV